MSAEKAQHTPGPWTVEGEGIRAIVRGADFTIVAVRHRLPKETHDANARLIAAAPDLLALAKQYASECSECGGTGAVQVCCGSPDQSGSDDEVCCGVPDTEPCGACADLRAVIEKAEGRA